MDGRLQHNEITIDIEVVSLLSTALKRTIPVVVDTGFTGDLQLTYQEAFTLGLVLKGVQPYRLADGSSITFFSCLGLVSFNGQTVACSIDVKPSGSHLIGMQLLKKLNCSLAADFVNDTARFEVVKTPPSQTPPTSTSSSSSKTKAR